MNKIFYFWQLCLLCFIVSSCKDTDEQPSQHTLVGKWYFVTTQEKENNQRRHNRHTAAGQRRSVLKLRV